MQDEENRTDDELLEAAEKAYVECDFPRAAELLERVDPSHPDRYLYEAHLRCEEREWESCEEALRRAEELVGADDPHYLYTRARSAAAFWELKVADKALDRLWDVGIPDALRKDVLLLQANLAELKGQYQVSDALWNDFVKEFPEEGPAPPRLSPDAFLDVVRDAAAKLPEEFRGVLDQVGVIVEPIPSAETPGVPLSALRTDLLGLYQGMDLADYAEVSGEVPPRIYLFQRNLEAAARDRQHLIEEIHVTLYHELGHALGFDEDEVDEMGLG